MKKGKDNSAQPSPDPKPKTEKLKKQQEISSATPEKKTGKNGGARPGAGRKPLAEREQIKTFRELIEQHASEEVDLVETDRASGTTKTVKRKTLTAIMDMLRTEAIKNKSIPAAKEYLDRVLGKSVQPLEHSGDIGNGDDQYVPDHPAVLAAREAFYATLKRSRE